MRFPDKATLESLKEEFATGSRVELERMDDDETELKPGDMGTVLFVKWNGTIFVDWDCGSRLGAIYGIDRIRKVGEL